MTRSRRSLAVSLSLLALACGSSGADPSSAGGAGKVTILLKDAPADVKAAVVTIARIELVGDGAPVVLRDTPVTTDLLTLAADVATLVDGATVPAGTYAQLRFVITGAYLDVAGTIYASSPTYEGLPAGTTVDGQLQMPSYAQSGLKVILPDGGIVVGTDSQTWVVDFDVSQSFGHAAGASGKWVMHPVVKGTRLEQIGNLDVTLALSPTTAYAVPLEGFTATVTTADGGTTTLPLTARTEGLVGATFPMLPAGAYTISITAPEGVTGYVLAPTVPATATVVPGQTTTEAFLLELLPG